MKRQLVYILTVITSYASKAYTQKLPHVQGTSMYAPANVKIDGKINEWNNGFQAYNNATQIYYTIANDQENLYMVLQATREAVIRKIINGGITIVYNINGQKNDKKGVAITYPKYVRGASPIFIALNNQVDQSNDTLKARWQADSIMKSRNKEVTDRMRLIGVIGLQTITDSTISIYNNENIHAKALFDPRGYYNYELAVPLKIIGLTGIHNSFAYHIKLNSMATNGRNVNIVSTAKGDRVTYTGSDGVNYTIPPGPDGMTAAFTTDFWGNYILAEKP